VAISTRAVHINEILALNPGRPDDPNALIDMDGRSPGWIELYNPASTAVDLTGWALSDDPGTPGKWVFQGSSDGRGPSAWISGQGYLVIFCGGWPRNIPGVERHADFELDRSGSVTLSRPDGQGGWERISGLGTLTSPYPTQRAGVGYGRPGDRPDGEPAFFRRATPGGANEPDGVAEFCATPRFDVRAGIHDAPFRLTISCSTPGATLSVTYNGDSPDALRGQRYEATSADRPTEASIEVERTTVLRVRAWKLGLGDSAIATRTFLFPGQVLQQAGPLPSMGLNSADTFVWGATGGDLRQPPGPDWEVDPAVVNHATAANRFTVDDLRQLPVVSLVTAWGEAFGPGVLGPNAPPIDRRGFYVGAAVGVANEGADRDASLEFMEPEGGSGFQADGHVHVFGGTSQNRWKSYKLSMNFRARERVDHPVYGDDAATGQKALILDARLNNTWIHPDSSQRRRGDYVRDQVMADLQNAMGGQTFRSRAVHLFLNGLYWGLYSLHERPEERFMEAYLGGDSEEWDVLKHNGARGVDGGGLLNNIVASGVIDPAFRLGDTSNSATAAYWNSTAVRNFERLLDLVGLGNVPPNPSPDLSTRSAFEAVAAELDVPAFIDYMLLNFVAGNTDWGHKNLYASYRRSGPEPRWRWHSWDAEHVFRFETDDVTGRNDAFGPTAIHQRLVTNAEYRLAFADAVHRHLFHEGVLSTEGLRAAFRRRFAEIEPGGVRGESARWGDNRADNEPYTYQTSWLVEKARILDLICPSRGGTGSTPSSSPLNQLRAVGLYSAVKAPEFVSADTGAPQHGGRVPAGFLLRMVVGPGTTGAIHFTIDGSDPRIPWLSAPSTSARVYTEPIRLQGPGMVKARVLQDGVWSALNEAYFAVGTEPARAGNLVIAELHYRPSPPNLAEAAAGFDQRGFFEYLELLNVSTTSIDLSGVRFGAGLDFTFNPAAGVRVLAPGSRAVLVAHVGAFRARYGASVPIAGSFRMDSRLDDSGERVELFAADGSLIEAVSYDDRAPWPELADGAGYSLVRIRPEERLDPSRGDSWRASRFPGGNPGMDDRIALEAWRTRNGVLHDGEDVDDDGVANLVEYAFGTDPVTAASRPELRAGVEVAGMGTRFATLTWVYEPAADDVRLHPQFSSDLVNWTSDVVWMRSEALSDGKRRETWRSAVPRPATEAIFARVAVMGIQKAGSKN